MHKIRWAGLALLMLMMVTPWSAALNVANSDKETTDWTFHADLRRASIAPSLVSAFNPLTVTDTITLTVPRAYLPIVAYNYAPSVAPVTPNDPLLDAQWGLAQVQAGMAWNLARGSPDVIIAVLDTGVDAAHPDLSSQLVPGHNFANGSDNADVQDDCGHGTHVAGIAAAATDNGIGVAGLGWNTKIMPVKVLSLKDSNCTGADADVIKGIDWAVGRGARIINMSLGGPYTSIFDSATTNAFNNGVLVVAAAGNCGTGYQDCVALNQLESPAGNVHVLGVAATTSRDARASFSTANTTVDIAAPGDGILSTWPTGSSCFLGLTSYCYLRGTSMATPFVSGLAALVSARFPSYTPNQTAQAIVYNADRVGGKTGWSQEFGCGRINAYRTLLNGATGSCSGWSGLSVVGAPRLPLDFQEGLAAGHDYVPGEALVVLRKDDHGQVQAFADRHGFGLSDLVPRWRIYRLSVPTGQEQAALDALRTDPSVEAASPNWIVRPR